MSCPTDEIITVKSTVEGWPYAKQYKKYTSHMVDSQINSGKQAVICLNIRWDEDCALKQNPQQFGIIPYDFKLSTAYGTSVV